MSGPLTGTSQVLFSNRKTLFYPTLSVSFYPYVPFSFSLVFIILAFISVSSILSVLAFLYSIHYLSYLLLTERLCIALKWQCHEIFGKFFLKIETTWGPEKQAEKVFLKHSFPRRYSNFKFAQC